MKKFKYTDGRIIESLQYIARELKEFENDYQSKTWQEYQNDTKLQKLIDRTVENILTALIEICGTILTQESIRVESYAQVLKECAKHLGFSENEQNIFAQLAVQRNRLAHRYLNFRWQTIEMFKNNRHAISKLLQTILNREES